MYLPRTTATGLPPAIYRVPSVPPGCRYRTERLYHSGARDISQHCYRCRRQDGVAGLPLPRVATLTRFAACAALRLPPALHRLAGTCLPTTGSTSRPIPTTFLRACWPFQRVYLLQLPHCAIVAGSPTATPPRTAPHLAPALLPCPRATIAHTPCHNTRTYTHCRTFHYPARRCLAHCSCTAPARLLPGTTACPATWPACLSSLPVTPLLVHSPSGAFWLVGGGQVVPGIFSGPVDWVVTAWDDILLHVSLLWNGVAVEQWPRSVTCM